MIDKEKLFFIKKISLGSKENFKKLEIYFDVLNYKLIFIGLSAPKTSEVVKTWKKFINEEVDLNENLNYDFNDVVQKIYNGMIEKEKTLETIKNLFKDVDSVVFNEQT